MATNIEMIAERGNKHRDDSFSISCISIFLDLSFPESGNLSSYHLFDLDFTQLECIGNSSLRYRVIKFLGSRACLPPDPILDVSLLYSR